ncbi:hypothetical protein CSUI_003334 [Cystoisospora suis]|uniref:Uncharacterized protein n=1 Tax=Cystoisospora suis TaxID=483139 RepID=A0A2C6L5D8_9APIC|nr:hypothetical protein CSUI_003334 [Cystoisospora suis]
MLAGLRWKPDGLATSMQRFCTKFGSRHVRDICTGTRRLLEHKIKSLGSAAESPLETLKLLRMVPLHPLFLREGPEESPLSSPPDQPDSTPRLLEVEEYLLPIKTADPDNRMGRARLLDLLEYRSCVTDVANSDQFNDISKSGMPNWIQLRFTSLLQPPEADAMATGLLVNAMDLRGAPLETRRQCERAGDRDCDTSEATAPPAGTHLTRTASSFTLVLMARIAAVFDADEHRGRKCGADGSAEESRRPACARLNAFLKFRKAARGAAEEISRLSFSDFDAQVKQICLDYDTTTVSQAETRHMRDLVHGKALITTSSTLSAAGASYSIIHPADLPDNQATP